MTVPHDLAIIGGGINGAGIARDAAGRGFSVVLFEQDDLASATSQWSTKLIHGGLRYLEHYEFRLVREALIEREVLLSIAPHLIRPVRFVLPHHAGLRPAWLLRLGLFLYDHLGGRKLLPATRGLDLTRDEAGAPLKPGFARGFEYSDAAVDDARLVLANARDAARLGAAIRTRRRVVAARRLAGHWEIDTCAPDGGAPETASARAIVNAAGPWVADLIGTVLGVASPARVRLVQGSHIVVRKLFAHDRPYIFQNADGRIIFAIPYQDDFTLIGTTDQDYVGDPAKVAISAAETAYLCAAASEYFAAPIVPEDVVWAYSGVRPLYDDGATKAQEATRDYVLKLDAGVGAPLLSIFGGKITTYRRLAEAVLADLAPHLPRRTGEAAGWTGRAPLPGGDVPGLDIVALAARILAAHPFLAPNTCRRLANTYGTEALVWLAGAESAADLGEILGADLGARELAWMMEHEWAMTPADVLWRRSKLGLRFSEAEVAWLADWMAERAKT